MNVVRRVLIRSAGIRTLVRPHAFRNPPVRFSTSITTPNDTLDNRLDSNPYKEPEAEWQPTQPEEGSSPEESVAFLKAMSPVVTLAELQRISKSFAAPPTIKHYTWVIKNCFRTGNHDEAFKVYDAMKGAGIGPDSRLAASIFSKVAAINAPSPTIDKVLEIYRDCTGSLSPSTSQKDDGGLTAFHYGRLFHLLLLSPDAEKYSPILDSLIQDMELNGLQVDQSSVATTKIIMEMRKKRVFAKALDVYRQYRAHVNDYGFFEILQEYCRISFVGALDVPLITEYFSIVNDMRLRRMTISPNIYGLIINHIIVMTSKIGSGQVNGHEAEAHERLVSTIRRVHDYLTLDASFAPDVKIWNQLMDAYQRLDCFGDAYRLWEMMYLTRGYDQISVTIMFDACGYCGHYDKAKSIFRKLERARFKLDLRNWNTWVECLCRLRRFNEALDVVFIHMPYHGVQPNVTSIDLLSKFARRNQIPLDFIERVKTDLPRLWQILPNTLREQR